MAELIRVNLNNDKYIILANSVIGKKKIENQDSYKIYHDDSSIIICVSDGLGSAKFSKEGSSKAVELGIEFLKNESFNIGDFKNKWKEMIGHNYEFYDTTFKFIKITNDYVMYGGIGDGWISFINEGLFISELAEHQFANQTDTLLNIGIGGKFINKTIDNKLGIALIATDGFSEDIEKSNSGFLTDMYESLLNEPNVVNNDLEELMNDWPVKTNADDKTVIFVVKEN